MVLYNNIIKPSLLILLCSLLFLPLPTSSLWWREAYNSGHTLLFLCIALVLYYQIKATKRFSNQTAIYLLVVVVGLVLGAAVEVLQGLLQRDAGTDDLTNNILGLVAGIALLLSIHQKSKRKRALTISAMLVFLMLGTSSLFQLSWHYIQRNNAFPVLVAFNEHWTSSFTRFNKAELLGKPDDENHTDINRVQVRFNSGQYPGISIIEPEDNWSAYRILRFNVFSSNKEDIKLVLRIHDISHNQEFGDRFNQQYIIQPGINNVVADLTRVQGAPNGRVFDMANIAGVELFLNNIDTPLSLELSDIFLGM